MGNEFLKQQTRFQFEWFILFKWIVNLKMQSDGSGEWKVWAMIGNTLFFQLKDANHIYELDEYWIAFLSPIAKMFFFVFWLPLRLMLDPKDFLGKKEWRWYLIANKKKPIYYLEDWILANREEFNLRSWSLVKWRVLMIGISLNREENILQSVEYSWSESKVEWKAYYNDLWNRVLKWMYPKNLNNR